MAYVKRNEFEQEADRLFILGLVQKGGRELTATEISKVLNKRREKIARERALATGKSDEEAEAAARAARLTEQLVRRDLRIVALRVQEACNVGMAAHLDDRIKAARHEIESLYLLDEQIMDDIERSRHTEWRRRRGIANTATKSVEPSEIVDFVQDRHADPALYGRLQENVRLRETLRDKETMLRYGRLVIQDDGQQQRTLVEAMLNMDDPEQARKAAEDMLRRESLNLASAANLGITPELARLDQIRTTTAIERLRRVYEFVRGPAADGGDGDHPTFELIFNEVKPRKALVANTGTELDGSTSAGS